MNAKIVEVGNDEDDTGPWVWVEYENGYIARIATSIDDARKLAAHLYEEVNITVEVKK